MSNNSKTMNVCNFSLVCFLTMACVTYGSSAAREEEVDDKSRFAVESSESPEAKSDAAASIASLTNDVKTVRMTKQIKSMLVEAHNSARSIVTPGASNMWEMSWDKELQKVATDYSKQCLFQHNSNRSQGSRFWYVGENIMVSTGISFDVQYANSSVWAWDAEKKDYNYDGINCTENKQCGHYTQVVWAESFKVGCGASLCSQVKAGEAVYTDATLLVCNYGPGGNIVGQPPYKVGSPCSECAEGDTCVNNLCSNPIRNAAKPTNPKWSPWVQVGNCSVKCGKGVALYRRTCNTFLNKDCKGKSEKTKPCKVDCPEGTAVWNQWGNWQNVGGSCVHKQIRKRTCSTGKNKDCCKKKS